MMTFLRTCAFLSLLLYFVTILSCGSGEGGVADNPSPAYSAKAITTFSFTSPVAIGVINENAKTISVTVPYGTNVTALVATFATTGASVKVGSTIQTSGRVSNDFTNPIAYTVTADDGSIATYTATVTIIAPQTADPSTFTRKFVCTFAHHNWSTTEIFMKNDLAAYPSISGDILYRSRRDNNYNMRPPDNPDWWVIDDTKGNLSWFTPVMPRNQWYWAGGASAVGVAAWSYSVVSPDQWSEEETEGGTMNPDGLGPAVRVDPKTDTMYHLSLEYSGDDYQGHAHSYVRLYKRVNGVNTLLYTFGEFVTWPSTASKLAVYGNPPVLSAAIRHNGYDPFEGDIVSNPWKTIGSYTDSSPSRILKGQPGLWNPYPEAEGTTHWSYGAPN